MVLTWVLRGLCAPGLGQFLSHFPCGSLLVLCACVVRCAPVLVHGRLRSKGLRISFLGGLVGPQEKRFCLRSVPSRKRGFLRKTLGWCLRRFFVVPAVVGSPHLFPVSLPRWEREKRGARMGGPAGPHPALAGRLPRRALSNKAVRFLIVAGYCQGLSKCRRPQLALRSAATLTDPL